MAQNQVFEEKVGLSLDEASIMMGLGKTKLYDMIRAGDLPARKIGRRTVILREDALATLRAALQVPVRSA